MMIPGSVTFYVDRRRYRNAEGSMMDAKSPTETTIMDARNGMVDVMIMPGGHMLHVLGFPPDAFLRDRPPPLPSPAAEVS